MNEQKLFTYITNAFNNGGEITNKHGKNIINHSIGVYKLLKELKCNKQICIAGLLHDILEDTNISEDEIKQNFGDNVLKLVITNTMNKKIDKKLAVQIMIKNCISIGFEALIIKSCDIYDSYRFYLSINNKSEIERTKVLKNMIIEQGNEKDLILLDNILSKIV